MNFVWGILIVVVGSLIVIFGEKIYNFTGSISLVENKFPGSSRSFIKLIGVVMIIAGLLIFSGALGFLTGPLGEGFNRLFGGFNQN